jgi:hypothetical protein
MAQNTLNAWEKAAACEAQARSIKDDRLKVRFRRLRDSWIRIANDAQLAADPAQNEEEGSKR